MNKYIVEAIGTFFLVFTIGCVSMNGMEGCMAPLAIGSALMVMIYAGGHISGGHYNPAVTLSVFLRGKCSATDFVPYWVAQLVGAAVAAFSAMYLFSGTTLEPLAVGEKIPQVLGAEFLFTFALCFVVLNVATAEGTANNSFYGLAIGFTVLIGAYAVGPVSGGAFNPAVALGGAVMKIFGWTHIWVYLVANLVAAAAAAAVFRAVNGPDEA